MKLRLAGHYAGKNIILADTRFVNGEAVLEGTKDDVASLARYLGRSYQAFPADSAELEALMGSALMEEIYGKHEPEQDLLDNAAAVQSKAAVDQEEHVENCGCPDCAETTEDEIEDSAAAAAGEIGEELEALAEVIYDLDPEDDANWTQEGWPTVVAVAAAANKADVSRREIDAAVGDYDRDQAREDAEESEEEEEDEGDEEGTSEG